MSVALAGAYTVSSRLQKIIIIPVNMQYIRIPRCYRRIGFPSGDSVYGPFLKTKIKRLV